MKIMPQSKEQKAAYMKEYKKEYYEKNKEQIAAYNKEYNEKNKEQIATYNKEYNKKNKEQKATYMKEYYEKTRKYIYENFNIVNIIECKDKYIPLAPCSRAREKNIFEVGEIQMTLCSCSFCDFVFSRSL